jgi:glutamine cyclotransferase
VRTTISHVVFWTLASAVILTMLLLGMPAKAGELYTVTTLRSYHVNREAKYNEQNYGIGLEYQFNRTWTVSVGEYKNSFSHKSNYYGVAYTPFTAGDFKAGLFLFNVSGYVMDAPRRFQPIAIPAVVWEGKGWGLNTVLVPPIGNKTGVLGVQVKFNVVGF